MPSFLLLCYMSVEKIIADWKKGKHGTLYWFEGEEPYFIDKLINYAEDYILPDAEKEFNLSVFYGKEISWTDVVNTCRKYPMFGKRQVVIIKEAQFMRDILKLEPYFEKPLESTTLIVAYKGKKLDGRSKLARLIKTSGILFNSQRIYESRLPDFINRLLAPKGLSINHRAQSLLIAHIGNELSQLENELEKVIINLEGRTEIDEDDIENYVGISKQYNVFELQNALSQRNLSKSLEIIQYFKANPKAQPIQLLLPTLYSFFSKAYLVFGSPSNDEAVLARHLGYQGPNPYIRDIINCARNYRQAGVENTLLLLHEYNLKSIGIFASNVSHADLLKEMVAKMIFIEEVTTV